MNNLTAMSKEQEWSPIHYDAMCRAISKCATVDDCNKAQSQAAAMAVYYHQIQNDEAWLKLKEIRLRAWRRMAEIIATVDVRKCPTQKAMVSTVRDTLGSDAVAMISDHRIIQLIKLHGIPERSFSQAIAKAHGSLEYILWNADPKAVQKRMDRMAHEDAMAEAMCEEQYKMETEHAATEAAQSAKALKEAEARADEVIEMVRDRAIMEGIGITLTAKAKANIIKFDVMMDRKMHEQLRNAAHERRTTMWEILREAANYWFVVNGYDKV